MATLEEILKLDSKSQLPHAKKSKTVAPRVSTIYAHEAQDYQPTPDWPKQQAVVHVSAVSEIETAYSFSTVTNTGGLEYVAFITKLMAKFAITAVT